VDNQLGLEPTPELYVQRIVEVFREVRRVLHPSGTLWLNLGDSYAGGGGFSPNSPSNMAGSKQTTQRGAIAGNIRPQGSIKAKDLVGIPWMVAFALRADGWYLRCDVIWAKGNPMPEAVTDRPTRSHEYVFLLTKSPRYFYDADAIREPMADYARKGGTAPSTAGGSTTNGIGSNSLHQMATSGRNKRSVWTINPRPYPEAHFATFPEALPRTCILAGTSAHGVCPRCSAP
jgi:DNA modification methylase